MRKNISPLNQFTPEQQVQKSNGRWNFLVGLGITIVLGGAYWFYKRKTRHPDQAKIQQIRNLIDKSFSIAEPNLQPLSSQKTKQITDQNISININYISQLDNKSKTTLSATRNPFLPPFQKGIMIGQLPPKHRLLYNKFYFYKNHLLVVTQQFEEQISQLSIEDLKQTYLVTKAINGLFFFNCGPESGYSQKHKHIQILPNEAFKLPIINQILEDIKSQKLQRLNYKSKYNIPIYLFKGYHFIHGIVVLPENFNQQNIQQASIHLKKAQETLFTHLSLLLKTTNFSYNVIGCSKFFMIIPRKKEATVGQIKVNAIIFMGSMLINNPKTFQQIQKLCKPTDILKDLTYTQLPR